MASPLPSSSDRHRAADVHCHCPAGTSPPILSLSRSGDHCLSLTTSIQHHSYQEGILTQGQAHHQWTLDSTCIAHPLRKRRFLHCCLPRWDHNRRRPVASCLSPPRTATARLPLDYDDKAPSYFELCKHSTETAAVSVTSVAQGCGMALTTRDSIRDHSRRRVEPKLSRLDSTSDPFTDPQGQDQCAFQQGSQEDVV